jgi:hypothetical protein
MTYEHAWALIYKILFHIGDDDAKGWKVVISNEEHDAQIIVPFLPHRLWLNAERPCEKFEARPAVARCRALVARMNGIVEIDAGENGENVGL